MKSNDGEVRVLLDEVRSVHNVGSVFRTAEAAGVSRVYCAGVTPAPIDRFGRKRADLAKVSLGAEGMVAWEAVADAVALVKKLKKEGFRIVAIEQGPRSVDYRSVERNGRMLVILGNEVGGVSKELLALADEVAEIPMKGEKESLNVSVAAGIALFRIFG